MVIPILIIIAVTALVSLLLTWILVWQLDKRRVLDVPNERSNHTKPVPRGGGIAVMTVILLSFIAAGLHHGEMVWTNYPIFVSAFVLALVSWIDDVRSMKALFRLLIQLIIISIATYSFFDNTLIFRGLVPEQLDKILVILLWVWFTNLYNFMDGIDGITGAQTIFITAGIIFIALYSDADGSYAFYAASILGASLGFLFWNWHPAKIFLGDVGSIPLGFLCGWLLLSIAAEGYWVCAIILPLYYLLDSTYTLLKRAVQRKKIWQAHSEHFYQRAVRSGMHPVDVVHAISYTNGLLVGLAYLSTSDYAPNILMLVFSLIIVIILMVRLKPKHIDHVDY